MINYTAANYNYARKLRAEKIWECVFNLDLACRLPTINSEIKIHITAHFFLLFGVAVKKAVLRKTRKMQT
jgi:hypothetical protein